MGAETRSSGRRRSRRCSRLLEQPSWQMQPWPRAIALKGLDVRTHHRYNGSTAVDHVRPARTQAEAPAEVSPILDTITGPETPGG